MIPADPEEMIPEDPEGMIPAGSVEANQANPEKAIPADPEKVIAEVRTQAKTKTAWKAAMPFWKPSVPAEP